MILDLRNCGAFGGDVGPVLAPRGALCDPAAEEVFLGGGGASCWTRARA